MNIIQLQIGRHFTPFQDHIPKKINRINIFIYFWNNLLKKPHITIQISEK